MNKCIEIGRLARDPELRYSPNGVAVCTFTIAVDRQVAKGHEREADFIPIVVFQKLAEVCANNLKKGRLVAVEGALRIGSYETKDGQKRKTAEIYANSVQFLDRAKEDGQAPVSGQENPEEWDGDLDSLPI